MSALIECRKYLTGYVRGISMLFGAHHNSPTLIGRAGPNMNIFQIYSTSPARKFYVCTIPLQGGRTAFMKVQYELSENEAIVICDPEKFLLLWETSNIHTDIIANKNNWEKDYKFHSAEQGFSHGIKNPVPLPSIGFTKPFRFRGFSNGISRTIWLMHYNAAFIPFLCPRDGAEDFNFACGTGHRCLQKDDFPFD